MARRPQEVNNHRVTMQRQLADQLAYNENLLKEISQTYDAPIADAEVEATYAERTLYHTWWDYVHTYVEAYRQDPEAVEGWDDAGVQANIESFGDMRLSFRIWWTSGGRERFIEQGELPIIRVTDMDQEWNAGEFPKHITLRIPLTLTPAGIKAQLDRILDICQPPQVLKHKASGATKKLVAQASYHPATYKSCLELWRIRKMNPDMPLWEVGFRAGLVKKHNPHDNDQAKKDEARRQLNTGAKRKLDQAEALMHFAVRGYFPREE